MTDQNLLEDLTPQQLVAALRSAQAELRFKQTLIDKLTYENAVLKRLKFAAQSEAYSPEQRSLLEETFDVDQAAVAVEIAALQPRSTPGPARPKRAPLPEHLPRRDVCHEPADTTCGCGCGQSMQRMGEDVAEKLDYLPGVFTVERHVRGKWVCKCCERIVQAPVPAAIIDKGLPTAGLQAQVLVAKYQDHLPLHRQEHIFGRAGHSIARSTLAQWVGECGVQLQPLVDALAEQMRQQTVLHADETPVGMLKPGKGKTPRAYLWSYCTTVFNPLKAVIFGFAPSRSGEHVRDFLGLPSSPERAGWQGHLVTDDYAGYKACFEMGVTEVGWMAHARRKFHELHVHHQSPVGEQAQAIIQQLYEVERDAATLDPRARQALRQARSRPIADALQQWLLQQRSKVPNGTATAKAIMAARSVPLFASSG